MRLVLSAYADDVLLVVQDLGDLVQVKACRAIYSAASSSWVNWVKSSGLVVGDGWQVSSLPPGLQAIQWHVGPLLYLSGYLSAMHPSPPASWHNLVTRVGEQLQRWTGLLWSLSLEGRALVLNQLFLSMVWHWLNTLSPAPGILAQLRRTALEFFWPGLHWVSAGVLSLPLEEGGQGLVCLHSQVHIFCLQALQRLLYGAGSQAWSTLAHAFLCRL
ncbi:unnamed protein product [Caretta caretta]